MFPISLMPNFNSNLAYGLVSILLVNYLIKSLIRLWKLPPGPWGLPIVGYLPFIKKDTHLQFTDYYKKYGPVFNLRIGSFDVAVINGWPAIKEAFASDHLLARPPEDFFTILGEQSFLEMSGDNWKEHRRVALTTLRNVGLGKTKMEDSIKEEIDCFIEKLKSESNKSVNANDLLFMTVPNNISILLFGHKFDYGDPKKLELDSNLRQIQTSASLVNVILFMPWLTKLLLRFKLISLQRFVNAFQGIGNFVKQEIDQHKKQEGKETDDYIYGFMQEMEKRSNDEKTTFTLTTLKRNTTSFYGAGSNTIRESLNWIFQILVAFPEYQVKIREEINQVLGSERKPDNVDRQLMPYTMAFIYEAQRFTSLLPINLPRRANGDVRIAGELISKDTLVYLNFWSVHRDSSLYPDPEKFDPTRFLNEDQTKTIKPPFLIPFSGGKRVCPGESLANLQLFLYLVNILQRFAIEPESAESISLKVNYTFARMLENPSKLIFTEIKSSQETNNNIES